MCMCMWKRTSCSYTFHEVLKKFQITGSDKLNPRLQRLIDSCSFRLRNSYFDPIWVLKVRGSNRVPQPQGTSSPNLPEFCCPGELNYFHVSVERDSLCSSFLTTRRGFVELRILDHIFARAEIAFSTLPRNAMQIPSFPEIKDWHAGQIGICMKLNLKLPRQRAGL